jgi:hypothetical protein
MVVLEVRNLVEALEFFEGIVGKEGPFFFDCSVVRHAWGACREQDFFTIGEKGKLVTMSDIMETLRRARDDETLEEYRWSDRGFFHEGFRLSKDGRTVRMLWGS